MASGRYAPFSHACPPHLLARAASFLRYYGTEFTSRLVDQGAYQNRIALHFIERGKPAQNGFEGKCRDECLNQSWFLDLGHARDVVEDWRVDYNTVRAHSSLRYRRPEEFAASVAARPPPTPVVSIAQRGRLGCARGPEC